MDLNKRNLKRVSSVFLMVLWMGLIFYFSSQSGEVSGEQSDMLKETLENNIPYLGNIFEGMGSYWIVTYILRKTAHMFLYFVLTTISYIVMNFKYEDFNKSVKKAVAISIIYAATDEIHQLYVPGRSGALSDVWIDSIGVFLSVIMISLIKLFKLKIRKKRVCNKKIVMK